MNTILRSLIFFFALTVPLTSLAATITVTNNNENSLRAAISGAGSGDEIIFNLALGNETISLSSQLSIDKNLTIDGDNTAGSGTDITIDGNDSCRVFYVGGQC